MLGLRLVGTCASPMHAVIVSVSDKNIVNTSGGECVSKETASSRHNRTGTHVNLGES